MTVAGCNSQPNSSIVLNGYSPIENEPMTGIGKSHPFFQIGEIHPLIHVWKFSSLSFVCFLPEAGECSVDQGNQLEHRDSPYPNILATYPC